METRSGTVYERLLSILIQNINILMFFNLILHHYGTLMFCSPSTCVGRYSSEGWEVLLEDLVRPGKYFELPWFTLVIAVVVVMSVRNK